VRCIWVGRPYYRIGYQWRSRVSTETSSPLDTVRREIDALDDAIHDLIKRRVALVGQVARAKGPGLPIRPGREANILRRLVARHSGNMPPVVLVSIWRELMGALTRLQAPLAVAVCAPQKSVGYWDLARFQFGSSTPFSLHRTPAPVLRAVTDGAATVGVLPLPQEEEADPWWPQLVSEQADAPRVIARLPFIEGPSGRFENQGALAIGQVEPEPSGDDRSLVAIEAATELSRARLHELLKAAQLEGAIQATVSIGGDDSLWLVEIGDFVERDDARLANLVALANKTIRRVVPLGAYATPIRLG
jgi:chorismate mutase/prephenate dehydratase